MLRGEKMRRLLLLVLLAILVISSFAAVLAIDYYTFCKKNPMICIEWTFNHPSDVKAYCDLYPQKCKAAYNYLVDYCMAHKAECKNVCCTYFDQCKTAYNWVCSNWPGLSICSMDTSKLVC